MRSDQPATRAGGVTGRDVRDTYGVRLWSRGRNVSIDWTYAHQEGRQGGRAVDAYGLFAVQSFTLARRWWQPRLDLRVDIANGGGVQGSGTLREFNPLYASTGYLGEGQFLSLANLVVVAPGVTVAPAAGTNLSVEYGFAWRPSASDPVRGGGMREYASTRGVDGHRIGDLARLSANRSMGERLSLFLVHEVLDTRDVLTHAGVPGGRYTQIGTSLRY